MGDKSNIHTMPSGRIDAAALMKAAMGNEFKDLLLVGIDETGRFYLSGTTDNLDEINVMLDIAKGYVVDMIREQVPGSSPLNP